MTPPCTASCAPRIEQEACERPGIRKSVLLLQVFDLIGSGSNHRDCLATLFDLGNRFLCKLSFADAGGAANDCNPVGRGHNVLDCPTLTFIQPFISQLDFTRHRERLTACFARDGKAEHLRLFREHILCSDPHLTALFPLEQPMAVHLGLHAFGCDFSAAMPQGSSEQPPFIGHARPLKRMFDGEPDMGRILQGHFLGLLFLGGNGQRACLFFSQPTFPQLDELIVRDRIVFGLPSDARNRCLASRIRSPLCFGPFFDNGRALRELFE